MQWGKLIQWVFQGGSTLVPLIDFCAEIPQNATFPGEISEISDFMFSVVDMFLLPTPSSSSWSVLLLLGSSSADGSPSTSCWSRETQRADCPCGVSQTPHLCSRCPLLQVKTVRVTWCDHFSSQENYKNPCWHLNVDLHEKNIYKNRDTGNNIFYISIQH